MSLFDEVRKLQIQDETAFTKAMNDWDHSSGFTWSSPTDGQSFAQYIQHLANEEEGINLPEGYVPCAVLFAFKDGDIVARANIRHELNEFLLNVGGHIGYGVPPSHRRNSYASEILKHAVAYLKNRGLKKVLVTCDENNIASAKVIEANGGILEDIRPMEDNSVPAKKRYWITI